MKIHCKYQVHTQFLPRQGRHLSTCCSHRTFSLHLSLSQTWSDWQEVSPFTQQPQTSQESRLFGLTLAKVRLRAGGRTTSFPDVTGLPGHQLLCSEERSDKEADLYSCTVAVCNIEYLRHLLQVSHYKWMEGIQECFIRWELVSATYFKEGS